MRILVVNDDGINGQGLELLVEIAKEYGEVFVVAPSEEQSAKSHSITLRKAIKVKEVDRFGVPSYTVDSTPADCVRTAKYGLKLDFDMVFSGINKGFNLGEDITYSGTVAAAVEGGFLNIPSIAFSTSYKSFSGCEYVKEAIDYILNNNLFEYTKVYNVNVPLESKGLKITRQGYTNFDTWFDLKEDGYTQEGSPDYSREGYNLDTDTGAIHNNYVSITPLSIDRTDKDTFNKLNS